MSKFVKCLGIAALAMAINVGAAQAQRGGGHYGGGGHGGGWGYYGGGFAAGAILGGLLAAPGYYGPGPGYYYGPQPGGYYYGSPPGDEVNYCMQRFRSYDPRSGTYLGNDGYRHSCP